jgi:hypothetical protein
MRGMTGVGGSDIASSLAKKTQLKIVESFG